MAKKVRVEEDDDRLEVVRTNDDPGYANDRAVRVMVADSAAEIIWASSHPSCKDVLKAFIISRLEAGDTFQGSPRTTYRLAGPGEVVELMNEGKVRKVDTLKSMREDGPVFTPNPPRQADESSVAGSPAPKKSAPATGGGLGKNYVFDFSVKTPAGYAKQPRLIIEILRESGRTSLNEAAIREILKKSLPDINRDPVIAFKIYYRNHYGPDGLAKKEG